MSAQAARPTPFPTKVWLVATLAVAATALASYLALRSNPVEPGDAAVVLCLLSGLFVLRVVGQLIVRTQAPHWLPPTCSRSHRVKKASAEFTSKPGP